MSDSQEQLILSPQCIIESDNPNFNESGKKVFGLNVANHDDVRLNLTHSDGSDVTNLESEGILTVNTGAKGSKEGTSLQVTSHHGDIGINAEDGSILIKADGKSIVLDAENIILKGRKLIQIGGPNKGNTQEVKIISKKIQANGDTGNIPNVLAQHLLGSSCLENAAKGTTFATSAAGKKGPFGKHPKWWIS